MAHPAAHPHAVPHSAPPDPRRRRALVVLCLAQFMVILDITVVNIALPAIGADLALDRSAVTWVVTAYTLCFGGLMLLGGRLSDLYGRRRVFLTGLVVFTLASLLSPSALSIVTTTFHGPERHRALGVWAAIGGGGAAAGVLLGGVLTSGPELGAGLGVALISTLAATGIGAAQLGGFGDAYRAAAIGAAVVAVTVAFVLPKGRPPVTDGPIFAH
ncbi:MFS transporter [Planobispora takensis]|uniref:Major facilitator superfamily (MFS) profile domain-containing protein n=1 Tax=Planobispora takensis TaxID=1367882 RepID=A0A8J3T590_9ACTN|nr:MFS transporter [Planobispora takensis]GII04350.1 hypothetical protein Pta02_63580 [Planobispora takensis]